jgi:hypothetical protein
MVFLGNMGPHGRSGTLTLHNDSRLQEMKALHYHRKDSSGTGHWTALTVIGQKHLITAFHWSVTQEKIFSGCFPEATSQEL